MYAEERQQAMAHLISRRGRLSVVQLADQFDHLLLDLPAVHATSDALVMAERSQAAIRSGWWIGMCVPGRNQPCLCGLRSTV